MSTKEQLNQELRDQALLGSQLALIAVSEIPLVGGVLSGLGGLLMGKLLEYEPESLTTDDVKKLIKENDRLKARQNFTDKLAFFQEALELLTDNTWGKEPHAEFKSTLDGHLRTIRDDTTTFMPNYKKEEYSNSETYDALPYFVIWANIHLILLKMRTNLDDSVITNSTRERYKGDYTEKVEEYTKYLYDAYLGALEWRFKQVKTNKVPTLGVRPFQSDTEEMTLTDDAILKGVKNIDREYSIDININDAHRLAGKFIDIFREIKNQWCCATKTYYHQTMDISSILEKWHSQCPGTLPTDWKKKVAEEDTFLKSGWRIVTITAKYGKYGGHPITHKDMNVQLDFSGRKITANEIFVLEPIDKKYYGYGYYIHTLGKNMGGYLSHGHGNIAVKFHALPGEEWIVASEDFDPVVVAKAIASATIPSGAAFNKLRDETIKAKSEKYAKFKGKHDVILGVGGESDQYLHHKDYKPKVGDNNFITCKFWKIEDVTDLDLILQR